MSLGIFLVGGNRPQFRRKTVFTSPGFRFFSLSLSKLLKRPSQKKSVGRRPPPLEPYFGDIPHDPIPKDPEPPAYVPTSRDYPLLKKWIFHETWDTGGWNRLTNLGQVHKSTSSLRQRGIDQWKFSFVWKTHGGEKYTCVGTGNTKVDARKKSAERFLATLHEKGILSELSREVTENNEQKELKKNEQKEIVSKSSQMRINTYNYGAKILAIPKVEITPRKSSSRLRLITTGYTVSIKLEECNIHVEESGASLAKTEFNAYSKFKSAVEAYHAAENTTDNSLKDDGCSLNVSCGKDFVFYYRRKVLKANNSNANDQASFKTKERNEGSLVSVQINMDEKIIGTTVYANKFKEAEPLAYLTAAIDLAQRNPSILKMFFGEKRSSSGEIIQSHIQVPLSMSTTTLDLISAATAPIKRSRKFQRPDQEFTVSSDALRLRRPFRSSLSQEETNIRNHWLKSRLDAFNLNPQFRQLRQQKESLPMNQYKKEVLELVKNNTFSVIVGETGSGKTTQVPAIIFEEAIARGKGASINIMCTQPRRIAAKSVASRVAFERGENLQETIGYHVYLDVKRPKQEGSICYCTTEILLKQLQNNPDEAMESISHIIVDEAHERDIPIDFLLITLKRIIKARRAARKSVPKVIIMSATLNISLFANYFGDLKSDGKVYSCPSLTVPGKTFPVKKKYVDELLAELKENYGNKSGIENCSTTQKYLQIERNFNNEPSSQFDWTQTQERLAAKTKDLEDAIIPHNFISVTIAHIVKTSTDGAILTFLPGLKDLEDVQKALLSKPLGINFGDNSMYRIILLHSLMKDAQNTLFEPCPPGCRKIILATNIAETSITIPDVRHVVDTGKLNEMNFDPMTRIKNLKCTWVSKSNSKQRSGRAGRVQNGYYYALFSEERFESFRDCGLPQLLRSDLKDVCLSTKGQTLECSIQEFLADAIEKPSSQAVDAAIKDLIQLGALTRDEQITPLGQLLHSLPVDPDLGKMIVLGVIFRCFDPLLTLAAAESEKDFFMRPISARKEADQARFAFGRGTNSDAITLINAFRHARHARRTMKRQDYMGVMIKNFLNAITVETIEKKMFQIEEVLVSSGVIPRGSKSLSTSFHCGHPMLNENSDNQSLIKALILARCPGNLSVRIGTSMRYRTKTESGISIRSGLNGTRFGFRNSLPRTALVSYATMLKDDTGKLCLRDTNLVNPLAAALFGGSLESRFRKLVTDDWIIYNLNSEREFPVINPYGYIFDLRLSLDKVLSDSFLDLARRRNLLDNRMRWEFTSAIAEILTHSDKLLKEEEDMRRARQEANAEYTSRMEQDRSRLGVSQGQRGHRSLRPFLRDLLTEIEN
ncbi:ATP-dependent RNA helicase DHX36 [Golovinomyces cichoracearum]|uniref:RNA helicase n=1 Tax=Golovinomyces cichoracearum TaxID=62708 RepID=A0A420HIG1_9PEZI|nr:ATP-dependent RNA helicase DHX36 [Golovinomyces cichoracearum]